MHKINEINFFFEEIKRFTFNREKYREWIIEIIKSEGSVPGFLNVIFTTDELLLELNKEYIKKDDYTDVITFDYTNEYDGKISGDIFISIDRICANANKFRIIFENELRKVIAHGILHLLGYDDYSGLKKTEMSERENHYLNKYI